MDAKQNISSIRHFLKKRHWVSDVFAGMCLTACVVVSVFVNSGKQGKFPVLDDVGESGKSVSPHGARLEERFRWGGHHVL